MLGLRLGLGIAMETCGDCGGVINDLVTGGRDLSTESAVVGLSPANLFLPIISLI